MYPSHQSVSFTPTHLDEFVGAFAQKQQLVPHLHLPGGSKSEEVVVEVREGKRGGGWGKGRGGTAPQQSPAKSWRECADLSLHHCPPPSRTIPSQTRSLSLARFPSLPLTFFMFLPSFLAQFCTPSCISLTCRKEPGWNMKLVKAFRLGLNPCTRPPARPPPTPLVRRKVSTLHSSPDRLTAHVAVSEARWKWRSTESELYMSGQV